MKALRLLAVIVLVCSNAWATVDPLCGTQQTWHFDTLASAIAKTNICAGHSLFVDNDGSASPRHYWAVPLGTYICSSPHCANSTGTSSIQIADDYTVNNSFVTTVAWINITGKPASITGYASDAVANTLQIIVSGAGMTVNGGASTTLAGNVTFVLDRGTSHTSIPFYDDSRFTNDRVASGFRDATGIVDCSASSAPVAGYVPMATDATHCTWQAPPSVSFGAVSAEVVGGSNVNGVATTAARSDHVHALPAFGTTAGTFTQGNDSRLSDDRTASAIRTGAASVPISISSPVSGQVLTYNGTNWVASTPSGTTPNASTTSTGVIQLAGDIAGTYNSVTVTKANGNTLPSGSLTTGWVMQATGTNAWGGGFIANANIGTGAAIAESKLAACGSYNFVADIGSGTTCVPFSDTWHGNRSGGSLHSLAGTASAGFLTALGTIANRYLKTDGAGNQSFSQVQFTELGSVPANFTPAAHHANHEPGGSDMLSGLSPSQFAACSTYQFYVSNGSSMGCAPMTDSIHGALGGGTDHALASSTTAGFIPAQGTTANRLPVTNGSGTITWTTVPAAALPIVSNASAGAWPTVSGTNLVAMSIDGINPTWGQVQNAMVHDIAFSKLTGLPTPTCTAPVVCSGTIGALNISVPNGVTGSLTTNAIPYATGSATLADSPLTRYTSGDVLIAGTGHLGSPFVSGCGFKHVALGTTECDGTNWQTPGVGTNAIAMVATNTSGVNFYTSASTGSTARTTSNAAMDALRRMLVADYGVDITGSLTASNGATVNGSALVANAGATVNGAPFTANAGANVSGAFYINNGVTVTGGADISGDVWLRNGSPAAGKVATALDSIGHVSWSDPSTVGILTRTDPNTTTNKITNIWNSGATRNWDSSFWFYTPGPVSSLAIFTASCGDWAACASLNTAIIAQSVVTLEVSSISAVTGGVNSCVQTFNGLLDSNGITTWEIAQGFIENTNLRIGSCAFAASPVLSVVGGNNVRITITDPANQFITMKLRLTGTGAY